MTPTPQRNKENERLSVATDFQPNSARNSIMSAASILSTKGKRKTHVGPWQLGRTLGKGATGRVRLAKHAVTGHTAAIKIVSKKSAAMVQSESIAAMDRNMGNFPTNPATRQMPCGIEREVVIMKLIEHPNVISLYDVWENRGELFVIPISGIENTLTQSLGILSLNTSRVESYLIMYLTMDRCLKKRPCDYSDKSLRPLGTAIVSTFATAI
jgi:serine/threonine protein kinase